ETPGVLKAPVGSRVVSVSAPGLGARNVVVFEWLPGIAPDLDSGDAAIGQFKTLGAISARMHRHARAWPRPAGFTRPRWDYEFATTVTFMQDHHRVPELRDAWVEGYRTVAELEEAAEAELDTFVMLRRLLIVAWIGSHHMFAPEAAELGPGYTAGSCTLAENYLSTHAIR